MHGEVAGVQDVAFWACGLRLHGHLQGPVRRLGENVETHGGVDEELGETLGPRDRPPFPVQEEGVGPAFLIQEAAVPAVKGGAMGGDGAQGGAP